MRRHRLISAIGSGTRKISVSQLEIVLGNDAPAMVAMRVICDKKDNHLENNSQYISRSWNELLKTFPPSFTNRKLLAIKVIPSVLERTGVQESTGKFVYALPSDEGENTTHIYVAIGTASQNAECCSFDIKNGFGKITSPLRAKVKTQPANAYQDFSVGSVAVEKQDYRVDAGFEGTDKVKKTFINMVGLRPHFYVFFDLKILNMTAAKIIENVDKVKKEKKHETYDRMSSNCAHFILDVLGIKHSGYGNNIPQTAVAIIASNLITHEKIKAQCLTSLSKIWMTLDPVDFGRRVKLGNKNLNTVSMSAELQFSSGSKPKI